jgi:hypothetical protein
MQSVNDTFASINWWLAAIAMAFFLKLFTKTFRRNWRNMLRTHKPRLQVLKHLRTNLKGIEAIGLALLLMAWNYDNLAKTHESTFNYYQDRYSTTLRFHQSALEAAQARLDASVIRASITNVHPWDSKEVRNEWLKLLNANLYNVYDRRRETMELRQKVGLALMFEETYPSKSLLEGIPTKNQGFDLAEATSELFDSLPSNWKQQDAVNFEMRLRVFAQRLSNEMTNSLTEHTVHIKRMNSKAKMCFIIGTIMLIGAKLLEWLLNLRLYRKSKVPRQGLASIAAPTLNT